MRAVVAAARVEAECEQRREGQRRSTSFLFIGWSLMLGSRRSPEREEALRTWPARDSVASAFDVAV